MAISDPNAWEARMDGTYYATISQVWKVRPEAPRPIYAQYLCRTGSLPRGAAAPANAAANAEISYALHTRANQRDRVEDAWGITFNPFRRQMLNPVPRETALRAAVAVGANTSGSHNSSDATDTRNTLWPVNIFGFRDRASQVAQFVPADDNCAMTWWFITDILFGGSAQEWTWNERQVLIHGLIDPNGTTGTPRRLAYSGIKHMCTNKARIAGQRELMDKQPCLLIVPIMTAQDARDWRGGWYEAVVLIDSSTEDGGSKLDEVAHHTYMTEIGWRDGSTLDEVAWDTQMAKIRWDDDDDLATNNDIDTAGALLRMMMLLIRHYVSNPPIDMPLDVYTNKSVGNVTKPNSSNNFFFQVPFERITDNLRVRKIRFSPATDWNDVVVDPTTNRPIVWRGDEVQRHMAPDPLLLVARAALVFSSRHGNRFAAVAGPLEDDDDDWRHQYEEEQFLEYLQSTLRPPEDPIELARALGQLPQSSPAARVSPGH